MRFSKIVNCVIASAAMIGISIASTGVHAQELIENWNSFKIPAAPPIKPVTLKPSETALLLLDFNTKVCNAEKRPRCFTSLPKVIALYEAARSHGVTIIYSLGGDATIADIPKELAAKPGDPIVQSGVDKFMATDLEKILKDKGIKTVVATGTSAHGAVLYTASEAALRKFNVIVPVDGISADDPFAELSTAWILVNAPASVSSHLTLTKTNLIQY